MKVRINDNFFNEIKKFTLTIENIDDIIQKDMELPKDIEITNKEFNQFLDEYAKECMKTLKNKIKTYFTNE